MTVLPHPLARSTRAIRILHHTIIDVMEVLEADAFSLDGHHLTIRRHACGTSPALEWQATLGDWLIQDQGRWSFSADPCPSAPEVDDTELGWDAPTPSISWSPLPF